MRTRKKDFLSHRRGPQNSNDKRGGASDKSFSVVGPIRIIKVFLAEGGRARFEQEVAEATEKSENAFISVTSVVSCSKVFSFRNQTAQFRLPGARFASLSNATRGANAPRSGREGRRLSLTRTLTQHPAAWSRIPATHRVPRQPHRVQGHCPCLLFVELGQFGVGQRIFD
jgi:hypothetical protein